MITPTKDPSPAIPPKQAEAGAPGDFLALHEVVAAARPKLPRHIWDYLIGAVETETTLARNRLALDSLAFRPRVLRDVSNIDATSTFFGKKVRLPILLAPVGGLESLHPGAGISVAKGAAEFGIPMFLSSASEPGLEPVAEAAYGFKIYQLYVRGDDAFVDDRATRAIAAGYDLFCITVDTAVYSRRERDVANRFVKPWRARAVGSDFQAKYNWKDVERFKSKHKIGLILKGIATAEDALKACELGVEGIYVSNHGGRQLDHGRGTMDILPEIVDAVRGRATVIIDGSFSRGSDVVKAMILGADAVAIGRLYCYGLVANGPQGIVRVLELLEEEIFEVLGLLGADRWSALDPSFVCAAPPVVPAHVHSPFPHIRFIEQPY